MNRIRGAFFLFFLFIQFFSVFALAEENSTPPVLDEKIIERIVDEVSGSICFEHVRYLSTLHRIWGSRDYHQAAQYTIDKSVEYGLKEAKIEKYPLKRANDAYWKHISGFFHLWDLEKGELRLVEPYPMLISHYENAPTSVAGGSRSTNKTAELIYIGRGDSEKNYKGKEVKGKIVLFDKGSGRVGHELAVHKFGALGTIYFTNWPQYPEEEDAIRGLSIWPYRDRTKTPTFGFNISQKQGLFLKMLLDKGEKVVISVSIKADEKEEGAFELATAVIPGFVYPEEEFIVYAHLDHPKPGAHDNASGCAVLLEIARTLNSLIERKIISPPKRTIRFMWLPHMSGLYMYFFHHPEKIGKIKGGCNFDCVGANPAKYPLKFYVALPPLSLPTFLTDITNNLVSHFMHMLTGSSAKYRLFSPEGSRNMFSVAFRPDRGGVSDQDLAHTWPLNIPSIYFYDSPLPPRHSQINFLEYIDRTNLRRTSFLGAIISYAFAAADEEMVPSLLNEIHFRGGIRLRRELLLAKNLIERSNLEDIHQNLNKGKRLLKWGKNREKEIASSLERIVLKNTSLIALISEYKRLLEKNHDDFLNQLIVYYELKCRRLNVHPLKEFSVEDKSHWANIIPVINLEMKIFPGCSNNSGYFRDTLGEDFADRYKGVGSVLWMKTLKDCFNYIDGQRTVVDIYEAVQAELWCGGYSQRYQVSFEVATNYFQMLKDANIIFLNKKE
ncbi:MAG: DUF4910 domain-containing protein [Candidatus Aminicenantes bacterium]|nr:MAG: DUF4910 domain-containing protein [Candidatus Aminicenantes bacterium]